MLDEAVAALDVSIQAQILNLLVDIRERTGVALLSSGMTSAWRGTCATTSW